MHYTAIQWLVHWPFWVGCYICYSEEGPGQAVAPPRCVIAVRNVTAHASMASVPTSYHSMWHYNYLCTLNVTGWEVYWENWILNCIHTDNAMVDVSEKILYTKACRGDISLTTTDIFNDLSQLTWNSGCRLNRVKRSTRHSENSISRQGKSSSLYWIQNLCGLHKFYRVKYTLNIGLAQQSAYNTNHCNNLPCYQGSGSRLPASPPKLSRCTVSN